MAKAAPTDEEARTEGFVPWLTNRMRARLQGFPDDWEIVGGIPSVADQIGNAVAPVVAQAVGLAMYSALQGMEFDWEAILRLRHRREIDPPPLAPSTDDMTADPGVEVVPGLNSPASAFFSIVTSEAITFSRRIIPR
ncbi:DNA cytosine methyltransferase [Rhizobium leguminosarum]|uniref:DNA cytosine methyltransferase n=1 Tax=Rhizobium leguminosarum TaxID=384 RepID=UPI00315D49C7